MSEKPTIPPRSLTQQPRYNVSVLVDAELFTILNTTCAELGLKRSALARQILQTGLEALNSRQPDDKEP